MYSGDSAIVDTNARLVQNTEIFEEDGMIELRDLTGWREKQLQLQPPELETPIQEEVKDFPETLIGELVMSDEEDDMTPTTTDDSLLDDSPDNSWASININADGSIDLDLSEGETDNIEDIISLLSEPSSVNMSSIPPNLVYPLDETTKCIYDSPVRVRTGDRSVILTPITRDFDGGLPEGAISFKSNEFYLPILDTCNSESPNRPSTPFRPKSSPPSCHNPTCEQIIPTKGSPKVSRTAKVSIFNLSKARRAYSTVESGEEENRLRGGATIVAKLPYSRGMDPTRRRQHTRRAEAGSSDAASMSSMSTTPRPHLLSLGKTRTRASSSSGPSSSDKDCCPFHVRVGKRNGNAESVNTEIIPNFCRNRFLEKGPNSRPKSEPCASAPAAVKSNKPPTSCRLTPQPKRVLSIEDAIIQLSKRSVSPASDFTGSSSTSFKEKKTLHRTLSTSRITEELRAKLGLTSPHKNNLNSKNNAGQVLTSYKTSFERIMDGHGMSTQTTAQPPSRCYSDSHVNLLVKKKVRCAKCKHLCVEDQGSFSCGACVELQAVKNAFVLEIFADRSVSAESRLERTTCYGIRVGAGLIPVVVMFISLIVCSVILLSDSIMSSVCGSFCNSPPAHGRSSPRNSVWGWLDP